MLSVTAFTVHDSGGSIDSRILARFHNKGELEEFLSREATFPDAFASTRAPYDAGYSMDEASTGVPHSQTNVQVEGVDEDDFVKTDGRYIYVSSGYEVSILRAYPAEDMEVISSIPSWVLVGDAQNTTARVSGLFLSGDRLVVIASLYTSYRGLYSGVLEEDSSNSYDPSKTMVAVFDISDPTVPVLEFSTGISGYVMSCRMIDSTVYAITQHQIRTWTGEIRVPITYANGEPSEMRLSGIRYDPETPQATRYVNVLAVDLVDGDHESLSILAGWASTIYMSSNSLYLTIQKWRGDLTVVDDGIASDHPERSSTSIYRIDLEGIVMHPAATGDVTGWLLNQFSMDEHESYLRVATTTSWESPENAVYVLNEKLRIVGALEKLAPDERIYSARFVGDKLYLVTFRQMDPLFVIDLSRPSRPMVVGMLEIPGFSNYLHPIDETHVLGIGQENSTVKLSLFNVSDPTSPVVQSKYVLEDATWSVALYDHKAVLYDAERELLVIPGYSYFFGDNYSYRTMSSAYVFTVSVSEGISLKGIITLDLETESWSGYIQRTLYIGEYLYTVSEGAVQANLIEDLAFVKLVEFANYSHYRSFWA